MTVLIGTSTSTAIANFGQLKTAIAAWLNRPDLTTYIPQFVRLGEQRILWGGADPYPTPPLRLSSMQARDTGSISSNAIAFPDGFLEAIRLKVTVGGVSKELTYSPPAQFTSDQNTQGVPSFYTYMNQQIEVDGSGSDSYVLDYWSGFELLQNDADENWLLTNAPSVYLYAALVETAPFLYDDPRFQMWFGMFKSAIGGINRSAPRPASGSLQVRVVK